VQRGVNVGPANRLDEGRDDVVVLIAVGVVAHRSAVHRFLQRAQIDDGGADCVRAACGLLKVGEYPACITARHRQHRRAGVIGDRVGRAQPAHIAQGPVDQLV